MSSPDSAVTKANLEAAIRRLIMARPLWFTTTVYVAAHLNRFNQWVLCLYRPTTFYKPDIQYEQHHTPPRYWWWMVKAQVNGSHDVLLLLEDVTINPIYVAVDHIGDAILEFDITTLNIYDRDPKDG
jgi:hypothetical protein